MKTALIIVHLIISLILIVVVLLQKSKQAGLSGAVAGGAETFFGKNKGRTVDAMLKKLTSVVAILFIVSSLVLAYVATRPQEAAPAESTQQIEVDGQNIELDGQTIEVTDGEAAPAETEAE